jgi:hypothetical protein
VRLTVECIERAGGERVIMHLHRRTAVLENQGCRGLSMHRRSVDLHRVRGAKRGCGIGGYLRARGLLDVVRWRYIAIIRWLRCRLGSTRLLLVIHVWAPIGHREPITIAVQPRVAGVDAGIAIIVSGPTLLPARSMGRAGARRRPVRLFANRGYRMAHPRTHGYRS